MTEQILYKLVMIRKTSISVRTNYEQSSRNSQTENIYKFKVHFEKYVNGFGSRIKATRLIMCVHFNIVIATHKFIIFSLKLIGLNFFEGSDS